MTHLYRIRDVTHRHRARHAFAMISQISPVTNYAYKGNDGYGNSDIVDVDLKVQISDELVKELNKDKFWVYQTNANRTMWEFVKVDG